MKVIKDRNGNVQFFGALKNMVISNGKITVDGKPLEELIGDCNPKEKVINITIEGDVERLDVDICETIHVTGDAKRIKTNSGDIKVDGDVDGDVQANCGNIEIGGDVEGDCLANCGSIYRR